jgi:outer membrane lipoprotein-sorting protein
MPRRVLIFVLVAASVGCTRSGGQDAELLSEAMAALTQRDRRLFAYRLEGTQQVGDQQARFTFSYRAPNRMRGEITEPLAKELAFDGQTLYELIPDQRALVTHDLRLSLEQAPLLLNQLFAAFIPDGYRAPLVVRQDLTARREPHPRAPEAVTLETVAKDASGKSYRFRYAFRWPAMDFLEKRFEVEGGQSASTAVEEEHCEPRLKLCVPKRLVLRPGEGPALIIQLDQVVLNEAEPVEAFTLALPPGYERRAAQDGPPNP